MLTDENQAIEITRAAAVALGIGDARELAKESAAMTGEERAAAHRFVEAVLAAAIALAIVAPRRFVDLRQL